MLTTVRRSRPKGPLRAVPGATNNRKIGGRLCYCDITPPARVQRPRWTCAKNSPPFPAEVRWRGLGVVLVGAEIERREDRSADLLWRVRVCAVEVVDEFL